MNRLLITALLLCPLYCLSQQKKIYGEWKGYFHNREMIMPDSTYSKALIKDIDSVAITMRLEKYGKGVITYSDTSKPFRFEFSFKKDSIIIFYTKKTSSSHSYKLSENKLYLTPYPKSKKYNESIDIIDFVEYKRILNE